MKRILFFIGFLAVASVGYSQVTLPFRADSMRFYKQGGSAEFILENSTRAVTGGVLTNIGNGRTAFVTPSGGGSTSLTSQQIAWGNPSNVITSSNSLVFTTTNRFGINTGGSPTATLDIAQASISAVGSGTGTSAPALLNAVGANGGASGSGNGGHAGGLNITMGDGGTGTGGTGGNGGNLIFAGGGAGIGTVNGVAGFVEFKGGSAPVTGNSAGGSIFVSPGAGVGSGLNGSIYLGVTSSATVRGNVVIGATSDDGTNKLQLTGPARFLSLPNNANQDSALRTTSTGVVEQYRQTDFGWTVSTGFDSLIWDKSAHELQAKALNITINGSGPTKTITDSTILYDFTVAGGGSLTSTRIGFGDGANLLTGDAAYTFNNTTKTQTQILSGDTIDISPSGILYSPPSSRSHLPFIKVKPFDRGSDELQFTTGVFKVSQWSGAFSPNIVAYWGFNATTAGGQLEAGKPTHTFGMETNYKPDSSAGSRWNETYLQHTFDDGVSFRPFFNVINEPARTSVWSFAGNQFDWVDRFQNAFGGVAFDSTNRKGTFNISSTPYGGVGWQVQADSVNNTVNLTATGGLSTSREVVMSGLRNFSFVTGNGGSVKANTDYQSTGNGSGFQFDERDATSNKWIWFGNANYALLYSTVTSVTPVKFHHSAPVNSLVLASSGELDLGHAAAYNADYSAQMTTDRYIPDIGKVNSLIAAAGGGLSLAAIGSSPNANGATLSSGVLNLEPASTSFGGIVTTGAQSMAGVKTWTGNAIFQGTGAGITSTSGTSGAVLAGTSFGVEASSVSVPSLGTSLNTAAGVVIAQQYQRGGSFTAAAGDGLEVRFTGRTSTGISKDYALLHAVMTTVTNGAEVGAFEFRMVDGGGTAGLKHKLFGNASVGIYNGTAPGASITDGTLLYSEDVAASSELKVRDEAGNITVLSPHNFTGILGGRSNPMAWAYYSERDGKYINVDMYKLAELVERLTGEKLIHTGEVARKPNLKNK